MPRILIVDDSPMVRKFHSFVLTSLGYEVEEAEDGYIALEKLLLDYFDLIITDINMPRMDGCTFIRELTKLRLYEETPIIVVSTHGLPSDFNEGQIMGANLYFIKPTEIEKLVSCIRSLLVDNCEVG